MTACARAPQTHTSPTQLHRSTAWIVSIPCAISLRLATPSFKRQQLFDSLHHQPRRYHASHHIRGSANLRSRPRAFPCRARTEESSSPRSLRIRQEEACRLEALSTLQSLRLHKWKKLLPSHAQVRQNLFCRSHRQG